MTDKEKLIIIESILKSKYSCSAMSILIKSLFLPKGWKWTKQWIMNFCNTTDYQWRFLSKELRQIGCLTYKHTSHGDKEITQTMLIDLNKINSQDVDGHHTETQGDDIRPTEKTPNIELKSQEVEISACRQSTPIVLNNTKEDTLSTVVYNDVDCQHDDTRPPETQHDDTRHAEINNIPKELQELNQWVYWRNDKIKDKNVKVPYCGKHKKAKTNDPTTWLSFKQVMNYDEIGMSGIGFVLTANDPYVIIDLDDCIDDKSNFNKFSMDVCNIFKSYTEVSPSGKGLHIVIRGELKKVIKKSYIEVYSNKRYMCFTGELAYDWYEIIDSQAEINRMEDKYTPPPEPPRSYPKNFNNNNNEFHMPKDKFHEGCRDNQITVYCGILQTKNLTEDKYLYWIDRINSECCSPPLSSDLVRKKAERLWRAR